VLDSSLGVEGIIQAFFGLSSTNPPVHSSTEKLEAWDRSKTVKNSMRWCLPATKESLLDTWLKAVVVGAWASATSLFSRIRPAPLGRRPRWTFPAPHPARPPSPSEVAGAGPRRQTATVVNPRLPPRATLPSPHIPPRPGRVSSVWGVR